MTPTRTVPADLVCDFVIVGGGTAGCVLAGRLSASGVHRVVLLEAGGWDRNPWIKVPFGMQMLITNPAVNWLYESEPVAGLGNRRIFEPRGKVVGGTGAINASLYVRGNRMDYDAWRDAGCPGWGYDDVLPWFRRSEHRHGEPSEHHGTGGPMWVSDGRGDVLSHAFLKAVDQVGLPHTADFNGPNQTGFGRFQTTTRHNRRHSSADGFLRPALSRANLRVEIQARATAIVIEQGRAVAVDYLAAGRARRVWARREVIVAGGTFNSPHLLELSGIGDARRLAQHGIAPTYHLPGVGQNLQEHFGAKVIARLSDPSLSLNQIGTSWPGKLWAAMRYMLGKSGPLAWTNTFAGGFACSEQTLAAPDLQLTLNAWSAMGFTRQGMAPHPFPGLTLNVYHLTPQSRGSVHLHAPDPRVPPAIQLAALDTEYDRRAVRAGIRLARRILSAPAMTARIVGEVEPGLESQSDAELDAFCRDKLVAMLHPVGTCKMGSDPDAVVDTRLRVRGLAGLRVIDASIMPSVPRGNTNAPTVMIAERGAKFVLEDAA